MYSIDYQRLTFNDIEDFVELRIMFALEIAGVQPIEKVNAVRQQLIDYFTKATANNTCISYLARHEGKIVGIGSVHLIDRPGNFKNISGKWGYIMNMFTMPNYRRKGISNRILNELMTAAVDCGVTAFELYATPTGEFVYTKNGFELFKVPSYRRYFVPAQDSAE